MSKKEKDSIQLIQKRKRFITMSKRKKYIIIFMIKEQNLYTEIKRKRFNPINTEINFKDKTYSIDVSKYSYSKGLKLFFFIDIRKSVECQLYFNDTKNKSKITPEILDMIISKKIIHQLTYNLTDKAIKLNLMMIIIGACIGGLIGYIIGGA